MRHAKSKFPLWRVKVGCKQKRQGKLVHHVRVYLVAAMDEGEAKDSVPFGAGDTLLSAYRLKEAVYLLGGYDEPIEIFSIGKENAGAESGEVTEEAREERGREDARVVDKEDQGEAGVDKAVRVCSDSNKSCSGNCICRRKHKPEEYRYHPYWEGDNFVIPKRKTT